MATFRGADVRVPGSDIGAELRAERGFFPSRFDVNPALEQHTPKQNP
jgi:hypothetical protein